MESNKVMDRILSDTFVKIEKKIYGDDPSTPFNQRILAVNEMYGWLYDRGILKNVSFVFKDFSDCTYFALDVKDLIPYRKNMEESGCKQADLAVQFIFDKEYTPCLFSGAFELGWMMNTYREFYKGSISRSWECDMVKHLPSSIAHDISKLRKEMGIKESVKAVYSHFNWEPSLSDQILSASNRAAEGYSADNASTRESLPER